MYYVFIAIIIILLAFHILLAHKIISTKRNYARVISLYRSVFARISIGVLVLDAQKKVKHINPACRAILKRGRHEELGGLFWKDLVVPSLVPVTDLIANALETGESLSLEFGVFLPEGSKYLKFDLVQIRETDADPIYVLSLEDKSAEDESRRKLSSQLEETHRYAVSKDNFFANMSHEIRTPINVILGMTYLVKKQISDEKTLDYIVKIEHASDLLLGVVNDILDFSKMQDHKFTLKPENFNLSNLKKILYDLFSLKASEKGLAFSVDFDCPDFFYAFGDQFRLTQIFMNLVSNAVKFTDSGFVSVFLNHEIIRKELILRCTVRDSGCGFAEEDLATLFTDYAQFGGILEKQHEGTGLGLAITKRLVELMDGVIWVDSAPGAGSSFHFVLVLGVSDSTGAESRVHLLPVIRDGNGRVLVVEDNEINAEIAGTLLSESGWTVEYADDGMDAVELCKREGPDYYDLVLMDIHMPGLNGYDTARILKKEQNIMCPIIAVTATTEPADVRESNRDVIEGYIFKPYNPEVFRSFGIQHKQGRI